MKAPPGPSKGVHNSSNLTPREPRLSLDRDNLLGLFGSISHWQDIYHTPREPRAFSNVNHNGAPTLGLDFLRASEGTITITYTLGSSGNNFEGKDKDEDKDEDETQEATLVLSQDLGKLGLGAVVWDCVSEKISPENTTRYFRIMLI